jgi:hypothetical protein
MQSPPFPVTSSLLGPNTLLNIIFSNNLSFLSSLNVRYQISHPYKTTSKILVLCNNYNNSDNNKVVIIFATPTSTKGFITVLNLVKNG